MDVQRTLEHDLELLCLTGVEDKLQVRIDKENLWRALKVCVRRVLDALGKLLSNREAILSYLATSHLHT